MLAYTQRRGQVLSSTVPAHRLCQTSLVDFTFCGAGLQPDEGPSALKYRACAQNVPDVTHRFYILRCCPTHRPKVKCSQVPCLRTESVRHHLYFLHFGMLPFTQIRGQVLSNTVPAHRMCQVLLPFFHFWMLAHIMMKAQVLSSTVPAHRMLHMH